MGDGATKCIQALLFLVMWSGWRLRPGLVSRLVEQLPVAGDWAIRLDGSPGGFIVDRCLTEEVGNQKAMRGS